MIASSLFHFSNREAILKIIKEKRFRASLCIENVQNIYPNEKYISIPMVCFCDIPLKFISNEHTERYDKFGLGLDKKWGTDNKINPILYWLENSDFVTSFNGSLKEINKLHDELQLIKSLSIDKSINFNNLQYHIGTLQSNFGIIAGHIKSYQEGEKNNYIDREWRWVPKNGNKEFQDKNDEDFRKKLNNIYWRNPDYLNFKLEDLKYLVVENKNEVDSFINEINNLKCDNDEEKLIWAQKIIDINSINSDM